MRRADKVINLKVLAFGATLMIVSWVFLTIPLKIITTVSAIIAWWCIFILCWYILGVRD